MAYAIIHHFPGATLAQYDATVAAVHPADGSMPKGQIFHAAGATPGGVTIMVLHDSEESWNNFRDSVLMPTMQKGVPGGVTTAPQETTFHVHKLQK